MPLILNNSQINIMLKLARELSWPVSDWWRDLDALEDQWFLEGYPTEPMFGGGLIPSGEGVEAVICRAGDADNVAWLVTSLALAGRLERWRPWSDMFGKTKKPLVDGQINAWGARRHFNEPKQPAVAGGRVACSMPSTKGGHLGWAVEVNEKGQVVSVQADPGGPVVPASVYSNRWFKLDNRDEAFDHLWKQGRVMFSSYMNMLSVLASTQKRLTGEKLGSDRKRPQAGAQPAAVAPTRHPNSLPPLRTVTHAVVVNHDDAFPPETPLEKHLRLKKLYDYGAKARQERQSIMDNPCWTVEDKEAWTKGFNEHDIT